MVPSLTIQATSLVDSDHKRFQESSYPAQRLSAFHHNILSQDQLISPSHSTQDFGLPQLGISTTKPQQLELSLHLVAQSLDSLSLWLKGLISSILVVIQLSACSMEVTTQTQLLSVTQSSCVIHLQFSTSRDTPRSQREVQQSTRLMFHSMEDVSSVKALQSSDTIGSQQSTV